MVGEADGPPATPGLVMLIMAATVGIGAFAGFLCFGAGMVFATFFVSDAAACAALQVLCSHCCCLC